MSARETLPPPFAETYVPEETMGAQFLAAILDHVAHPVFVKDREYRFVLLNKALETMLGLPRTSMLGKTDYDLFPEREAAYFRERDREVFERGATVRIEEETLTDGGGVRHVLATTKVPLRAADGAVTHLVGIIHDITALKRAEDLLREANETLEARVRERTAALESAQHELMRRERLAAVGQLAGAIAHQVRNPLGSIKNAAYLLRLVLRGEVEPDVTQGIAIIHEEVRRANQIITDLLDFARIRPAVPREVAVAYVVGQAVGGAASNAKVEVVTEVDEALTVRCDGEQLQTAVFNLVRHACEAMVDGGELRIAARVDGDSCVIEVSDTGPGLPEDVLEQLRDPLAVRERRVTLGLQLMTARALVENQQGTFAVESSSSGGTRYTLRVALA